MFEAKSLSSIEESAALAALSAAVYLRSVEATVFWRPLLKHCLTGKSTAPLMDLQSTAQQAEVLVRSLSLREAGPVRDEVLRLASEASLMARKWLPNRGPARPKTSSAARYRRGAFEKTEDEEGNLIIRPPPGAPSGAARPESTTRRVLSWAGTGVALFAMLCGVWVYSTKEPPALPLSHYQAFLPEANSKRIQGTELVLTVNGTWEQKPEERRASELERLLDAGGTTERYVAVRILDDAGIVEARIERGSAPEWGAVERTERPGTAAPVLESSEDGMLKRPLRANEIPVD